MYALYKYQKRKREQRRARHQEASQLDHHDQVTASLPESPGLNGAETTGVPSTAPISNGADEKVKEKHVVTAEEAAEKKRRRVYRWKIVLGLAAPFALQALDTTIIASALPYIAQDFHQIKQLNWIISSFNLTSAAFLFMWAQLTDIFGRHFTVQAAIVVMLIGSAICTGAPTSSFAVLLLGRGIQGVGAAGVNVSVRTILADRVSLKDYALNWTIFALVAGISFGIGPVIGGYLTETSWRWCFAINLPVGVFAIIMVVLLLRKELLGPQPLPTLAGRDQSSRKGRLLIRLSTIDYGGQMLFLWGLGLFTLALTWGGSTYAWDSAAVLAPLVIGTVLFLCWIWYEYSMSPGRLLSRVFSKQRAMIPWDLLSQRDVGLLFFINMGIGMAMFAIMYFTDLYFALVEGKSSGSAGLGLLYFLPGMAGGVYLAMFSSNIWPRQTLPTLLLGATISAVGITVLPWVMVKEQTSVIYGMMAVVGTGVGLRMNPASLHGLAYFPTKTAVISCIVSFAMPFGGLVGLTIMSTVFTNVSDNGAFDPKTGIKWAFVSMIPFMWICVILTTLLGNVWIAKDGGHEVVRGAYVWNLLRGKHLPRELISRGEAVPKLAPVDQEQSRPQDLEAAYPQRPDQVHSAPPS